MADEASRREIRALIVDDEPLARDSVRILLDDEPDIRLVGECGSGAEAVRDIRTHSPDLLFLDVQMAELDGFAVLEQLGAQLPAALVFVTAYERYALRAFDQGAIDYLLKPFDRVRFRQAIERARERIALLRSATRKPVRWALRHTGEILFLDIAEIDWIEAADYYVCLHVAGREHLLRRSMVEVARELRGESFCRVHRSAIVNLERVRKLESDEHGSAVVILADGARLPLSRRYRRELQSRLQLVDD